jgi:alkylation response protein AidB-like acyl-CoA dehydrogenase
MPYPDLDFNLTDEQQSMRDMVRKFGAEVVRPGGIELDHLADPADVIAPGSNLWDLVKQYRELGLHKTGFSKEIGGMAEDMDPMMDFVIAEEMGYADAGFAISMAACGMPFIVCQNSEVPALQELAQRFVADVQGELVGCWGVIEPEHGTDFILGSSDPKDTPSVQAELKGDQYIINGQKAAWVSNGTIATHCLLHMGLDRSQGMASMGTAVCPLDLPGISRGAPLNKLGQRVLNQGEIFFDDVQLPREYMLMPGSQATMAGGQSPMSGMSILFGGLAKAALDEAIAYARQRIQGGVPIIEHKNIGLKLFEMFMQVEAARSLARRQYLFTADSGAASGPHTMAGKWLSTETAFKVASEAIQIFGGNGLSKEYGIEKIFRDARTAMIEDGVNESLALGVVGDL